MESDKRYVQTRCFDNVKVEISDEEIEAYIRRGGPARTGYLVGTMDRWNDAKKAEEHDRVKHGVSTPNGNK